jgi:hypothetical protein
MSEKKKTNKTKVKSTKKTIKKSTKTTTSKSKKKAVKKNAKSTKSCPFSDTDLVRKILISLLAIVSFLIVTSIFYGGLNSAEEVPMEHMIPAKDVVFRKNNQTFENLSGDQYFCEDGKTVFVDIYQENDVRKAKVAVANNKGQYAMAYLSEIISLGRGQKFADGQSSENSLIIDGNEAKVFINAIAITDNCFKE